MFEKSYNKRLSEKYILMKTFEKMISFQTNRINKQASMYSTFKG